MIKKIFRNILFLEIVEGLSLTFKHMFVRAVTEQYPREKRVLPDTYRGILSLQKYNDGTERCVGCALCEAACPSMAITVVSGEDETVPQRRFSREYYIDITRCVFCGFCVDACPVDALAMTKVYEFSSYDKNDLFLNKESLLSLGDTIAKGGGMTPVERKYKFPMVGEINKTKSKKEEALILC